MKTITLWLIAVVALPAALAAQEPKHAPPPSSPRPESPVRPPASRIRIASRVYVGEPAPGFELTSANGKQVKLSRFRGDRVMLCFAHRRERLAPYAAVAESLRMMGVLLVGVCHDSPRSLQSLAARDSLQFELLSDSTGEVSAIYGAYDFLTSSIRPGLVLVGRTGLVRMVLLGQALPPDDLLVLTRYALTEL